MKKCVLIICSLSCFSHIDAGWRDQWGWFKSLFSGFSIKKPTLTGKQVVIGGVGALAVASAAWWWLKSPKKPKNQNKNINITLEQETSKKDIVSNKTSKESKKDESKIEVTINQPEEVKYEPVLVDKKEMFLRYDAQDFFAILDNHSKKETIKINVQTKKEQIVKKFDVETIEVQFQTKKEQIVKIKAVEADSIKKFFLTSIIKETKPKQNNYVFVNHLIHDRKIMLIGKYISWDQDKVTVLSGSLFHDVELEKRTYNESDVFVPVVKEGMIQIVDSDFNKETLTKKEEEEKRKELEKIESELKTVRRNKELLELQIDQEKNKKRRDFVNQIELQIDQEKNKKRRDFVNQTIELRDFETLLTQYENKKDEDNKTKLTQEFEKLNPIILEDSTKSWESLTKRYNNAIGLESK